jgi:F-type H+-transporting ATPase subunit c
MLNMLMLLQQATQAFPNYGALGAGIGLGLALIGAGIGLGRIGGSVAESVARAC